MMNLTKWIWISIAIILFGSFAFLLQGYPEIPSDYRISSPTPTGSIATQEQLDVAQAAWEQSAHADTYDMGLGANTTCARCKSPWNWDPLQEAAAVEALDCGACKRIPGAARPDLASGIQVFEDDWEDISCPICHIPIGDSYYTSVAFWNQQSGQYESVQSTTELCAHCHEGRHGFEVIEEIEATIAHEDMQCVECHGSHGEPSRCSDCHDLSDSPTLFEHDRHPSVNCAGCHDAGGLTIWYETDLNSQHYEEYVTRRFAHALTSWPSHNLRLEVRCQRCHHPVSDEIPAVVTYIGCDECHEHTNGAVLTWCTNFLRDPDPNAFSDEGNE